MKCLLLALLLTSCGKTCKVRLDKPTEVTFGIFETITCKDGERLLKVTPLRRPGVPEPVAMIATCQGFSEVCE